MWEDCSVTSHVPTHLRDYHCFNNPPFSQFLCVVFRQSSKDKKVQRHHKGKLKIHFSHLWRWRRSVLLFFSPFCVFLFCCHYYHLKTQYNSLVYREVTWNVKSDSKSKQNLYCEKCNSFSYKRRVITPYIGRKEYKYAYPIFVQITFGSLIRKYYFCIGFQNGN